MAKFKDLVAFENDKPERTIRLVCSGNFYRAYNRSAWLFTVFFAHYAVMRKFVNELNENVFYIGFPSHILLERIAGRKYEQTDKGYDVMLNDGDEIKDEEYEAWCATVVTESKSNEGMERSSGHHFRSRKELECHIIQELVTFPLMDSTPKKCLDFLFDMQQLLRQNKFEPMPQ